MEKESRTRTMRHTINGFQTYKKGELAKEILLMIAAGIAIPAAFLMPGVPVAFKPLLGEVMKRCGLKRSEHLVRSMTYLKKRGLISVAEKDGQQVLTLSENGEKRLLQFDLEKIAIKKPKRWDGCWRLVLFDIPENKRQGREALRSKLKQLGFYQLQKSCFVHPFDCRAEIDFVSELFEVSTYVNFIVAKEIEGGSQLRKYFNLSH